MKKIVVAPIAALVVALVGLAAPANADSVALPYGGTATLTIPDVTLPASGCISHYGTFSTTTPDYWNIDINYSGPSTWPSGDYLYGTGPQSERIVEFLMCASSDGPGTYTATGLMTVESPTSYDQREALVSDSFVVSHPAPPPPPPAPVVAEPPAPAVVFADVTGNVSSKPVTGGAKLTFKTNALPTGATVRKALSWTVIADGRVKSSFTQPASNIRTKTIRFKAKSGKHIIKVLRNGKVAKTVRVAT